MAITPYRTFSGMAFPILTAKTVGTGGVTKGDICTVGTSGDAGKIIAAAAVNAHGVYYIALQTAAAGATVDVCRITPDVVFGTTAQTGTPTFGQSLALNVTNMNLTNATTVTAQTTMWGEVVGSHVEGSTTIWEVVINPPVDVT